MHLTLHLTASCNMACRYCYSPPRGGPAMTVDTARAALAFGAAAAGEGSCGIVFFGGEPLLQRPIIEQTVAEAKALTAAGRGRFHFKITTNGLALDDSFLDFARREGVLIAMSFDGVREAHDAHRRLPDGRGTFDILLPRLRRLLAVKPYANVIMVVNPDTVQHFADGAEMLVGLGVRYLVVAFNFAAGWTDDHADELARQYLRLARRYVQWTRRGVKFYLSPFETKIASHVDLGCYDAQRCDLGRRQLSVDPDGWLFPCVQFPRTGRDSRWCVGHVATGLDRAKLDALNAEARRAPEPCSRCTLAGRCLHTCACLNWQATGSVEQVSPMLCRHEQILTPVAGRCLHTCACLNWQATGSVEQVSPMLCRHEQILTPVADRVAEILYRRRDPLFIQKHYNRAYPVLSLLEDAGGQETFDAGG